MSKYVPRPGNSERKIVRRSSVTLEVSRSRPRRFIRRPGRRSVGSAAGAGGPRTRLSSSRPIRACRALLTFRVGARALIAALAVLALATGAVWLWRSTYLEVKHVEVVGAWTLTPADVAAAAELEGHRMLSVDLGDAQNRVRALPLVRSVRAERRWPDTIVLTVEERRPWGTWEQAGVTYAIDREGVVLGVGSGDADGPQIVSAEPTTLRQGDRVSYQAVDAVAELTELLPKTLGTQVGEVAVVPGKGVQVTTVDGRTAILGDSSSIAYKLAVWAAVEQEAAAERINYGVVDLRFGNRPVLQ